MGRPEHPAPVGTYAVLAKERSVLMDSSSVGIPVTDPDGHRITVDHAVRITDRGLFVHRLHGLRTRLGTTSQPRLYQPEPDGRRMVLRNGQRGDPVIVQENSLEVPRVVPGGRGSR
jgi:hypothetical protein